MARWDGRACSLKAGHAEVIGNISKQLSQANPRKTMDQEFIDSLCLLLMKVSWVAFKLAMSRLNHTDSDSISFQWGHTYNILKAPQEILMCPGLKAPEYKIYLIYCQPYDQ